MRLQSVSSRCWAFVCQLQPRALVLLCLLSVAVAHASEQTALITLSAADAQSQLETLRPANQALITLDCAADWEYLRRLQAAGWSARDWADASLIASGEADPARRQQLLDRLDKLSGELATACQGKTVREQGELILTELHKQLMPHGYDAEQSSVAAVFSGGKYNCVSSSALYYLLAKRQGLTVQGLKIAGSSWSDGHVLVQVLDGETKIDVETTNPDGFDCRAKLVRKGGTAFGIVDITNAQIVAEAGLLQSLYNNRAVTASKAGQHFDSVHLRLLIYALTPTQANAQADLAGGFINWTAELIDKQEYAHALQVGQVGLGIAPAAKDLIENVKCVCEKWAQKLLVEGKDREMVAMYQRAATDWPTQQFEKEILHAYQLAAQAARDNRGWSEALELLERGSLVLEGNTRQELHKVISDYYRSWAQREAEAGNHDAAAGVYTRALRQMPGDKNLLDGVMYLAQESFPRIAEKSGVSAVLAYHALLKELFPAAGELPDVTESFVYRQIKVSLTDAKYDAAHQTLADYQSILTEKSIGELGHEIVDTAARVQLAKQEWLAAHRIYQLGLQRYPHSEKLREYAPLVFDRWASEAWDKKDWAAAQKIYEQGLQSYPDNRDLKEYRDACIERQKEG